MHRELWEMIVDLLDVLSVPQRGESHLRITAMRVDLPVDVVARKTAAGFKLLIDVPPSRWTEGFVAQPGRMHLDLRAIEAEVRNEQRG